MTGQTELTYEVKESETWPLTDFSSNTDTMRRYWALKGHSDTLQLTGACNEFWELTETNLG